MKQIMRPTLAAVAVTAALGVACVAWAQTTPKTKAASATVSKSQASEVVGYELANQYPSYARNLIDPKAVGAAVTRALEGLKPTLSDTQVETVQKAFGEQLKARHDEWYAKIAAENKQHSDAYLAKNKTRPGVQTTADGLQYQVITQGTGPKPTATDTIQINYTGSFVNGQQFASSAKDNSNGPAKLDLSNVFPGFKEAMMLMPVGSHFEFVIPPDLAYGSEPKNGFPPNEALIFDVTLVKIGAN